LRRFSAFIHQKFNNNNNNNNNNSNNNKPVADGIILSKSHAASTQGKRSEKLNAIEGRIICIGIVLR
jgi:hypothetical protein